MKYIDEIILDLDIMEATIQGVCADLGDNQGIANGIYGQFKRLKKNVLTVMDAIRKSESN